MYNTMADGSETKKRIMDEAEDWLGIIGEEDLTAVLKRYKIVFAAFLRQGWKAPRTAPDNSGGTLRRLSHVLLRTDSLDNATVGWSVCYALKGDDFIAGHKEQLNYVLLQAALVVTMVAPVFLAPPTFQQTDGEPPHPMYYWWIAITGLSTVSLLACIVASALFNRILFRPYTHLDSFLAFVDNRKLYGAINVFNYAGVFALLVALILSAVMQYDVGACIGMGAGAGVPVVGILAVYISGNRRTDAGQCACEKKFTEMFLGSDGRLRPEIASLFF